MPDSDSNSSVAGERSSGFMGGGIGRIRHADPDLDLGVQSGHFSSLARISPKTSPAREDDRGGADVFSV